MNVVCIIDINLRINTILQMSKEIKAIDALISAICDDDKDTNSLTLEHVTVLKRSHDIRILLNKYLNTTEELACDEFLTGLVQKSSSPRTITSVALPKKPI